MAMVNWTASDKRWQGLSDYQKAAMMALFEADGADPEARRNVLHAIINRAQRGNEPIGAHVSRRIYQPVIEPSQQARMGRFMNDPAFAELTKEAEGVHSGAIPRRHAETHYLAPERVMLALEKNEPMKYRSWRKWTGFDPSTNSYRGVAFRDKSHAFLSPEGRYNGAVIASGSVPGGAAPASSGSPMPPGPPAPSVASATQPPRGPRPVYTAVGGGGAGSSGQTDPIGDLIKRTAGPSSAGMPNVAAAVDPIASLLSRLDDAPATQGRGDGSAPDVAAQQRAHAEEMARAASEEGDAKILEILQQMRQRRAAKGGR